MNKSAILFITYRDDNDIINNFLKLKNDIAGLENVDLFVIYDNSKSDILQSSPLNYNLIRVNKQIIENLHIDGLTFHYYYWPDTYNSDFYGHNIELIHLLFYITHPEYRYYWIVEHDVYFTGNWGTLLALDDKENADYICSNLHSEYNILEGFKTYYKSFTPENINLQGFNAIYRMSNKGFNLLWNVYKKGNYGFYEFFYPTVITYYKYKVKTFNELGFVKIIEDGKNSGSTSVTYVWEKETHRFFNINDMVLPNTLYHPVKSIF